MSFFKFKQFTVYQDKNPMKVNTDSVMLGAWCNHDSPSEIIDVGTGTGLLALMAAQRFSNANITAVEILSEAANEATYNFMNSPWQDRIEVVNDDFRKFATFTEQKFDLIITNPPYFENQLLPDDDYLQVAKHTQLLTYDELFYYCKKIINPKGRVSLVIPFKLADKIIETALKNELFLIRRMNIFPNEKKSANRILLEFSDSKAETIVLDIKIRFQNEYTQEYLDLTREFYLFA